MKRSWTGSSTKDDIKDLDEVSQKSLMANSITFGPEGNISDQTGVSIFDPTLTEILYTWFSPIDSTILDPFAGGSVRGIVASKLKRNYIGVELRKEQVEANRIQGNNICTEYMPNWICEDSTNIKKVVTKKCDLMFTCPPYADLEVYSDDPKDISTMSYQDFLKSYKTILKNTVDLLSDNRFAIIIIGEVRDKKTGFYYGLVPDTIRAMEEAGAYYYNEIILVTSVGSLPLRSGKAFESSRKIGKTHQNILVFCKGNPKKATEFCGKVEIINLEASDE